MNGFKALVWRIRSASTKAQWDADMAEEMRLHIDHRIEQGVAAGMSPEEARYAALRQFGNLALIQERSRDQVGFLWVNQLLQDVRYAARVLWRSPGFTTVSVLTLTLGLGVNTSVFTLFYALALRPLPVPDPHAIVTVHQHFTGEFSRSIHGSPYLLSYPEYLRYRDNVAAFSDLVAFREEELSLAGSDARLRGLLVSDNYFAALRSGAALGRMFQPSEARTSGAPAIAVVSYACWQQRFGGEPDVVGTVIRLNRQPFTIVGVAGQDLRGTEVRIPEVWIPVTMQAQVMAGRDYLRSRDSGWLSVFGRLRSGVPLETARAQMSLVAAQADAEYPGRRTVLTMARGALVTSPAATGKGAPGAIATMIVAGLVMLIACANIANLLLTRAASRQREIGIRLAVGAGRGRLVRQLLTETLLLALMGGAGALLASYWLPSILLLVVPDPSFRLDAAPDAPVFLYGFALAMIAGLVFGLVPALDAGRLDVNAALNSGSVQLGRRYNQSQLRSSLVVAQVAVALILLVGAGLLLRGLHRAQTIDLGFEPKGLSVLSIDTTRLGHGDDYVDVVIHQLLERVRSLSSVSSAAVVGVPPFTGSNTTSVVLEGEGDQLREGTPVAFNAVSPEFFATLGVPMLGGRIFSVDEARLSAPVAVVSQTMAQRFWPGRAPIGQRFRHRDVVLEVIGIARDVSVTSVAAASAPIFYVPASRGHVLVRARGDVAGLAADLRQAARATDPQLDVSVSRTDDNVARLLHPLRAGSQLALVLGGLALMQAAIGLYGVMAYAATQQTKEIGVRMALGATRREVTMHMIRQGARLSALGIGIGLAVAMPVSLLLRSSLVGVSLLDPIAFAGVSAFLAAVTLVACYVPARRAAGVDPLDALRL